MSSPAFQEGGAVPQRYPCAGDDASPPLNWGARPEGSASIARNEKLNLPAGETKAWLLEAMEGHILGQGQLLGGYKRQ